MAETFPTVPNVRRYTLGGANVATRVNFPNFCRRVTVLFETNDGKVAFDGTDGAAIDPNYADVTADTYWQVFVDLDTVDRGKGAAPIFLASATGGTVVVVIGEAG